VPILRAASGGQGRPYIPLARSFARPLERGELMKRTKIGAALAICGVAALAAPSAEAKGCIRGAVAGGVAGHMFHHGVIGAAAGCVAARHYYKEKALRQQQTAPSGPPGAQPSTQPLEKSGYQ
jgi:hypothetical protein